MTESEFRRIVGENLSVFRRQAGLTQAEVASRIHYSDKSISKWERGDGVPDVFVLRQLAELYGVTLGELAGEAPPAEEPAPAEPPVEKAAEPEIAELPKESGSSENAASHSLFTVCLCVGAIWLAATVTFSVPNMLPKQFSRTYLAFVYAVPASFAVMELFAILWRLPSILHLLFCSGILWTSALSIHLSVSDVQNIFLIYIIAAVIQLLGIFALGRYWEMIRLPEGGCRALLTRRRKKNR